MASQKLAGILWLIAGISSGGIAFFLNDPLDLTGAAREAIRP